MINLINVFNRFTALAFKDNKYNSGSEDMKFLGKKLVEKKKKKLSSTHQNFADPLQYLRGPWGVRGPPVEDLCTRALRSQNSGLLVIPKVSKSRVGARAFSYQAPLLWNHLPLSVRGIDTICTFKSRLKTFLNDKALVRTGPGFS